MRAVGIRNGTGDADALFIEDGVPDPHPHEDRILVRIKAFGLNRMDTMQRAGNYPPRPHWGNILGVEFGGSVEKLGPDCKGDFRVGDDVFGLSYGGAYAEKICVSEKMLMLMPANLSYEEAAGTPETYYTAMQAVTLLGDIQPGKNVLIHAGASGVGLSAIEIAKVSGASKIFATAGTDEKCKLCEATGAHFAINYRTTDFAEVVEKETEGRGVDIIVDMVGRDYWKRNLQVAANDARLTVVATLSGGQIDNFDLRDLMAKRISIMPTTLRTRDPAYQQALRNVFVDKMLPALASGQSKTVVDKVYDWEKVSDAHKRMEANANAGKIICRIS